MTGVPFPSDPLRLLAEDRFLRGLARGLLRDAQAADDVVQDAWLAAMARPPRAGGALRAWLRTVVRNLVANRRAAEAARLRREQAAARPESVPSEEEVRAREALRREVVEHVLALPEPYRATVLLRYFEDLPPRAIAARLGVPSTTVRTRLHRALEMLRARLDQARDGDRRAWCLALIPLARPQFAGAAAVLGGGALFAGSVVMKKVFVGAFAIFLLLSGAGVLWVLDVAGVRGAAQASPAPAVAGRNDLRSTPPVDVERSSRRTEAVADAVADDPAAAAAPRTGQLLFADGAPAAGVAWWFEPGRGLPPREGFLEDRGPHAAMRSHPTPGFALRTAADGSFPVPTPAASGVLWCEPTAGVRVGFPVEATGTGAAWPLVLHLPSLADLTVICAGLGPQDRWKALVDPAVAEEDGEWNHGYHFVRLLDRAGGRPGERIAVEIERHFLSAAGPAPAVLRVLAGAPYHVSVEAEAFAITTPGAVHRAPAQVRFATGAQLFTLAVEVVEPDGRPAAVPDGRVLVSPRDEHVAQIPPLVGGRATVGWCDWPEGTLCDLRVLMADGELFVDALRVRANAAQPARRFVRGRGQPPQRVQFPAGSPSLAGAAVVVEAQDGRPLRLDRGAEFAFFPGQAGAFVAGPQELGLVAVAPEWRCLWVLLPDGQVGEVTNDGRPLLLGSWLAGQPLGDFDLAAAFRARRVAWANALFELEIVSSTGARSWQRADILQLEAEDEDQAIPVWRKHTPVRWRGRVRLESRSFQELLTPVR